MSETLVEVERPLRSVTCHACATIFSVSRPVVLVPGRLSDRAAGVRGTAIGSGRRAHEAVVRAGGQPLVLPPLPASLDGLPGLIGRVDAVMLLGGGDVDPSSYGEPSRTDALAGIVAEHDEVELAVARLAVARDLPVLAICRGCQVLNVALGGSLHQDLGLREGTDPASHRDAYHPIVLEEGSVVASAMGTTAFGSGHSWHHQAIDRPGDGLVVVGRAHDGVVEAVERAGARWSIGLQWHPEDDADRAPEQQRIFDAFVAAAQG